MLTSTALAQSAALTGQVIDNAIRVQWLSEMDGKLALELRRDEEWTPYDPTEDIELLVPHPWDGLYVHYIAARTYLSNGEYDRYDPERELFEATLRDYKAYLRREGKLPEGHDDIYAGNWLTM